MLALSVIVIDSIKISKSILFIANKLFSLAEENRKYLNFKSFCMIFPFQSFALWNPQSSETSFVCCEKSRRKENAIFQELAVVFSLYSLFTRASLQQKF